MEQLLEATKLHPYFKQRIKSEDHMLETIYIWYLFSSNLDKQLTIPIPKDTDNLELFFCTFLRPFPFTMSDTPAIVAKSWVFQACVEGPTGPIGTCEYDFEASCGNLVIVLLRTFTDLSSFPRIFIAPDRHTSCSPIKHVVMRLLGISYQFKLSMNAEPAISRLPCLMAVALIGCDCAAFIVRTLLFALIYQIISRQSRLFYTTSSLGRPASMNFTFIYFLIFYRLPFNIYQFSSTHSFIVD